MRHGRYGAGLLLLHPCSDVEESIVFYPEESLIGSRMVKSSEFGDIRSQFNIVEMLRAEVVGEICSAGVPCRLVALALNILCHRINGLQVVVASHKTDAGNSRAILGKEHIKSLAVKQFTYVFPQLRTMAARAMIGAQTEIDGEGSLVGNLLKHYIIISIFEHNSGKV